MKHLDLQRGVGTSKSSGQSNVASAPDCRQPEVSGLARCDKAFLPNEPAATRRHGREVKLSLLRVKHPM